MWRGFAFSFHKTKRGFELSITVVSQVLQVSGGEGFTFNFLLRKRGYGTRRYVRAMLKLPDYQLPVYNA